MPKFRVQIQEVHYLTAEIDAADEQQAREKVNDAIADVDESIINYDLLEYSHTLPKADWTVTKMK